MLMRGFGFAFLALWMAPSTLAQVPTKTVESVWISGEKLP
jgi:hypothetical protein